MAVTVERSGTSIIAVKDGRLLFEWWPVEGWTVAERRNGIWGVPEPVTEGVVQVAIGDAWPKVEAARKAVVA
jgi:hypothetical protein